MRAAIVIACLAAGLSGCAFPFDSGDGTRHYLVVGVGLISVPGPTQASSSSATVFKALGMIVSDEPELRLAVGYSSGATVRVPVTADALISVDQSAFGTLSFEQASYARP